MVKQKEIDPLMTPADIAKMFGVTQYTVRLWLRDGKLEGARMINSRWRVRRSIVEAFANQKYGDDEEEEISTEV